MVKSGVISRRMKRRRIKDHASFFEESMNVVKTLIEVEMIFFRKGIRIYSGTNFIFCGLNSNFFTLAISKGFEIGY